MNSQVRTQVIAAVEACEEKKAEDISILEMDKNSSAFTDYFIICTGRNPRQIQAISDEVELRLKRAGNYVNQIEGYTQGDWVLLDYVDFVVHVFSEASRRFYDLERLWKSAKKITLDELKKPATRARAAKKASSASRSKAPAATGRKTAVRPNKRRAASKSPRKTR
jgi:ribosome-associated protein